jgi:hypothetical protein
VYVPPGVTGGGGGGFGSFTGVGAMIRLVSRETRDRRLISHIFELRIKNTFGRDGVSTKTNLILFPDIVHRKEY